MRLRTAFGLVALKVWRGKDPADGHWGCPVRERWGLSAHQQLSPALEDKLAYFGTVASSYAAAAKLAAKLGYPVEDTTIRALVQRLGAKAEAVFARIDKRPLTGAPWRHRRLPEGVRRRFLRSFPYSAVYILEPRLVVVALAHVRRRPGYWAKRLAEISR